MIWTEVMPCLSPQLECYTHKESRKGREARPWGIDRRGSSFTPILWVRVTASRHTHKEQSVDLAFLIPLDGFLVHLMTASGIRHHAQTLLQIQRAPPPLLWDTRSRPSIAYMAIVSSAASHWMTRSTAIIGGVPTYPRSNSILLDASPSPSLFNTDAEAMALTHTMGWEMPVYMGKRS